MPRHDLAPFERQRRLIALKRFERPPQGYVDEFLVAFHQRQRREILERSSRSLFWERLATRFPELCRPGVAISALAAPAAALFFLAIWAVAEFRRESPAPLPLVVEPANLPVVRPVAAAPEGFEKPEDVGDSSRLDAIRLIVAEPPTAEADF